MVLCDGDREPLKANHLLMSSLASGQHHPHGCPKHHRSMSAIFGLNARGVLHRRHKAGCSEVVSLLLPHKKPACGGQFVHLQNRAWHFLHIFFMSPFDATRWGVSWSHCRGQQDKLEWWRQSAGHAHAFLQLEHCRERKSSSPSAFPHLEPVCAGHSVQSQYLDMHLSQMRMLFCDDVR